MKMETLEDYDVTMDTLYEYEKNYPVFYNLKETQRKLEEAKRQIHDLILRLYGREFDKCMLEFQWSVSEWKFDFISEKLGRPFDMHQLNHIIQELFFNPNMHIDIIHTLGTDIVGLSSQEECEECLHSHPPMPPLPSPPSSCSSSSEDLSENRSNRINEKME